MTISTGVQPDFIAAARAADGAAEARTREEEMRAVMEVMRHREAIEIALVEAECRRIGGAPAGADRLPLMEDGHEWGRVVARVPKKLFFRLVQQKNFGMDGFGCAEGIADLHKGFEFTKTRTVSGKVTVRGGGWKAESRKQKAEMGRGRRGRVHFGPGVLNLAT